MKIKQYKVCMRLGPIYEKCQTPKFTERQEKPFRSSKKRGGGRGMSDFGGQLLEKQKVKMTYGLKEKQFARMVKDSSGKSGVNPAEMLFRRLESRLDNVVYRSGLALTRRHARQMVSHGHITVNARRMSVPSYSVKENDKVSLTAGSVDKGMINTEAEDRLVQIPSWLVFSADKKEAEVKGVPVLDTSSLQFDLSKVVEFYSR